MQDQITSVLKRAPALLESTILSTLLLAIRFLLRALIALPKDGVQEAVTKAQRPASKCKPWNEFGGWRGPAIEMRKQVESIVMAFASSATGR